MPIPITRRSFMAAAAASPLALYGCGSGGSGGGSQTRSISYGWTTTLLEAISATRIGPPMTARAIALVATGIYDAWAAYDAIALGSVLGSQLRRPLVERTLANKNTAISYAAYRMLVNLYPTEQARFDAAMAALGLDPSFTGQDPADPRGVGNRAAAALITSRVNDGSNQANAYADTTGYVPVNTPDLVTDPSKWQRLRFANGNAPGYIGPHWGGVTPFSLTSLAAVRPSAPPTFGSSGYIAQAQAIIDLTANLNDTRKTIAEYWADGPSSVLPPGHWQLFGQVISARDHHDLDRDVKLFLMLGNAVFDAGIACWDAKRSYDTSRPITAIRALFAGQQVASFAGPNLGIQMVDGSQWSPYQSVNFVTPPFPEYSSGHSTFSAASAEILKRFTGSDNFGHSVTIAAGASGFETGVPAQPVTLSWATFSDAADQAGISRRYGGIHFESGDIEARRCGRLVASYVWDKAQSLFNGTAPDRRA